MEVKRLSHNQIDFAKWDQVVLSSSLPLVFAHSYYLNATCPNWDALVLGDYESIFPLTYKTKFGLNYLPQPPFTSQLGTFGKLSEEAETAFYKYIAANYKLIELEINASNTLKNEFIKPKLTYVMDYTKEYNFNQNTKRNISNAQQLGLKTERVDGVNAFKLSQNYINPFLKSNLKIKESDIKLFDQLILNSEEAKQLYSFQVTDVNQIIKAFGHFICNGKHALFLKGTNFDRQENSGSMHLLMSVAIDYFKDRALWFDFGGGSNSEGVANFYKGLGGTIQEYGFLRINNLPKFIQLIGNKH